MKLSIPHLESDQVSIIHRITAIALNSSVAVITVVINNVIITMVTITRRISSAQ